MRFPNIEKMLEDLSTNTDPKNLAFDHGMVNGGDQVDYWISDEWLDVEEFDEPLIESVLSLTGHAYGMLNVLDFWAELVAQNPKITVAQAQVVMAFETAVEHGWVAEWGLTPDIVRPPKGDGWEQYQAAKKAVGL